MTLSPSMSNVHLLKIAYISGLASANLTKACFSKSADLKKQIIHSLAISLLCTSGAVFAKFFTENKDSTSSESTSLNVRKTILSAFLLGSICTINSQEIQDKFFDCIEAVTVGFSIEKASSVDMESLQSVAVNATIRRLVNSLFSSGISTFTNLALGVTSLSHLLSKILIQKQSKEGSKNRENSSEEDNKNIQNFCIGLQELANRPTEVKLQSIPFLTQYTGEKDLLNPNPDITKKIYVIINQKKLNHVILCGEAGSGKTSMVRFFVNEILSGKYPKFQGSEVYKLDASTLGSNSGIAGTLAGKIQKFEKYIQLRKDAGIDKIIVCIDEIHQLCGMGTHRDNSNDVWQFLKEKLADPFIIILGTTTQEEYKRHIAKDEALKSRLTKLDFPSPSDSTKQEIIEFEAKKCVDSYPSLIDMTERQIKEVIERAKTRAEEECAKTRAEEECAKTRADEECAKTRAYEECFSFSKKSSKLNLRNVLKCLWFEFSAEDLKRAEVK